MKLAPKIIDSFLASPPKQCTTLLLYGVDQGVARHYRDKMLVAWGVDRHDPFRCNEYSMAAVEADATLIQDTLSRISMMGGAPCVIITGATDDLTLALKEARSHPTCSNPLIIMAGDLGKKSSLRAWCEDAKRTDVATIACYRDEGATLAQFIRENMRNRGIQFSPAVMQLMVSSLGNDRLVTAQELEKIDLYLGERRQLTEDDVLVLLTDNKYHIAQDALLAWIQGNMERFWSVSDRLCAEGESTIALTRFALNLVQRLVSIHQRMAEGMSCESAMKQLSPPVFFKDESAYSAAVKMWNIAHLMQLQDALMMVELNCKRQSAIGDSFFKQEMYYAFRSARAK
ncbi:MAG: DNA polymerase III subunit delta [Alphaproteobacteria bacterium]|nr:MAG: DNA polymerase III subunit delta [Alphaproteobacteria bacterium]